MNNNEKYKKIQLSRKLGKDGVISYLATKKRELITLCITILLLGSLFMAFLLPVPPLVYGMVLLIIIWGAYFFIDYLRVRKKTEVIMGLTDSDSQVPEFKDSLDEEYLSVIKELKNELRYRESETSTKLNALEEYYTIWAHQIKTPISAVNMLLEDEEPSFSKIKQEMFSIEGYVEMLLGYLRLDSPTTDYSFKAIPLDRLLRQNIRKYSSGFIRKKLILSYEGTGIEVITDEKWLSFLIGQLISNAQKYTNTGGITIVWNEEKRALSIMDTGIGIPKEDLPRVFEMGYTGFNGRIGTKSTGIGLALCNKIAKELSLTLAMESEVENGTTVSIIFPENQVVK